MNDIDPVKSLEEITFASMEGANTSRPGRLAWLLQQIVSELDACYPGELDRLSVVGKLRDGRTMFLPVITT